MARWGLGPVRMDCCYATAAEIGPVCPSEGKGRGDREREQERRGAVPAKRGRGGG